MAAECPELLQAVLDAPEEDAPRLVYADWFEEHGQTERAQFIRFQVAAEWSQVLLVAGHRFSHWKGDFPPDLLYEILQVDVGIGYKRGWPAVITTTLAGWYGGQCPTCRGGSDEYYNTPGAGRDAPCSMCNGNAEIAGLGPRIVACCPVEKVKLTDRRTIPVRYTRDHDDWSWWRERHNQLLEDVFVLPSDLFDKLGGGEPYCYRDNPEVLAQDYLSGEDADKGLSRACISWAKDVKRGQKEEVHHGRGGA